MLDSIGSAALGAVWGWLVVHIARHAFGRTRNSLAVLLSTISAATLVGLQGGSDSVPPFVVTMAAAACLHGLILVFIRRKTVERPVPE